MSLGRVLVEKFSEDVLNWLRERCDVVVVDPWTEGDRWQQEAPNVDAVISRKGQITREHMAASNGRLKLVARTGVGVDPSRVDLEGRVGDEDLGDEPAGEQLDLGGGADVHADALARAPHQGRRHRLSRRPLGRLPQLHRHRARRQDAGHRRHRQHRHARGAASARLRDERASPTTPTCRRPTSPASAGAWSTSRRCCASPTS